jgi:hypothetical protein
MIHYLLLLHCRFMIESQIKFYKSNWLKLENMKTYQLKCVYVERESVSRLQQSLPLPTYLVNGDAVESQRFS